MTSENEETERWAKAYSTTDLYRLIASGAIAIGLGAGIQSAFVPIMIKSMDGIFRVMSLDNQLQTLWIVIFSMMIFSMIAIFWLYDVGLGWIGRGVRILQIKRRAQKHKLPNPSRTLLDLKDD